MDVFITVPKIHPVHRFHCMLNSGNEHLPATRVVNLVLLRLLVFHVNVLTSTAVVRLYTNFGHYSFNAMAIHFLQAELKAGRGAMASLSCLCHSIYPLPP